MTPVELAWPRTPASVLLWSEVTLVWVLANYGPVRDPVGRQEVAVQDSSGLRAWRKRVAGRSILGAGAVLFLVRGGTHVVRAVDWKGGRASSTSSWAPSPA